MGEKLTIAIAQNHIADNVSRNGDGIRRLMADASRVGARLVHFPEGALSGYVKSQISSWRSVDWELLDNELQKTLDLARRLGIWVVLGCNHDLRLPNRPYNSLYVISEQGQIVARYDKRFCSNTEISDWYSVGKSPKLFEIDGFRFGCALCIEIQFPEVFAEYERLDADAVLFSAYSSDPMFWIQAQGHAASNNLWISVSVPAQCGEDLQGGLIGPDGRCVSRCEKNAAPQIKLVELNKGDESLQVALTKARPWRRLARSGDIYHPRIRREN